MKNKKQLVKIAMALTLFLPVVLLINVLNPFADDYRYFEDAVDIGVSEAEVRRVLGSPYLEYTKEAAPNPYYVEGWHFKKREISNKVLIYMRGEPICYIWINAAGAVEDFYLGGS
jgi:hypothetical protein